MRSNLSTGFMLATALVGFQTNATIVSSEQVVAVPQAEKIAQQKRQLAIQFGTHYRELESSLKAQISEKNLSAPMENIRAVKPYSKLSRQMQKADHDYRVMKGVEQFTDSLIELRLADESMLEKWKMGESPLFAFEPSGDEADWKYIEAFYNNCRFIFTCNYKNKIIEPLHSRCSVVEFGIRGKERQELAAKFFKRLQTILTEERVKAEPKVLVGLINKHFPDWRRVLNECQRYSTSGEIGSEVLTALSPTNTNELVGFLSKKEFQNVRKWVVQNLDNDPNSILRSVYDSIYEHMKPSSIPEAVLIIAKYQYQSAFSADQEINMLAAMTELMVQCEFK